MDGVDQGGLVEEHSGSSSNAGQESSESNLGAMLVMRDDELDTNP